VSVCVDLATASIDELDVTDHVRQILRTIVTLAGQQCYEGMLSCRTPTPCGTGRALALRQLGTLELAALNISAHSAARLGPTDSPPLTPTCRRSRPAPPTQHAHQPSPMPADDADQNRVIVVRPGQPSAGLASHRPNVDPHWPFNHIETADFHLDR
jgi:hypothetical protein